MRKPGGVEEDYLYEVKSDAHIGAREHSGLVTWGMFIEHKDIKTEIAGAVRGQVSTREPSE